MGFARAQLFLCGGEPALAACAREFVEAAGGARGRAALLLQGGPQLSRYLPRYLTPWLECGLGACDLIIPGPDGMLDERQAVQAVRRASAIFAGGGSTLAYHNLFVRSATGDAVRERCLAGVPYGGLSAGMRIAGTICPLYPAETGELRLRLASGLGLFEGLLCEPHFDPARLAALRAALDMAHLPLGFGVDEDACLTLAPGAPARAIGGRVLRVESGQPPAALRAGPRAYPAPVV